MARAPRFLTLKDWADILSKKKVLRRINGKQYFSAYPKRKPKPPSPAQEAAYENFRRCIRYSQEAIQDPHLKEAYQMGAKKHQSAANRACKDAFNPPRVSSIVIWDYSGKVGSTISVIAYDDFMVKRVKVAIYKNDELMEEGEAVEILKPTWQYTTTLSLPDLANVRIKATAWDLPGNSHSLEVGYDDFFRHFTDLKQMTGFGTGSH